MPTFLAISVLLCSASPSLQEGPAATMRFEALLDRLESGQALTSAEAYELFGLSLDLALIPVSRRGLPLESVELAEIAQRAIAPRHDGEAMLEAIRWRAVFLSDSGRLALARSVLEDALRAHATDAPFLSVHVLVELGALARATDDFGRAFDFLERALQRARKLTGERSGETSAAYRLPEALCTIYGEYGRLFQRVGNLDRARWWFEREREAAERSGDGAVTSAARLNRIRFAWARRDFSAMQSEIEAAHVGGLTVGRRADLDMYLAEAELWRSFSGEGSREARDASVEAAARALEAPELEASIGLWPALRIAHLQIQDDRLDQAERFIALAQDELDLIHENSTDLHYRYERVFLDAVTSCLARTRGVERGELYELSQRFLASFEAFLEVWRGTPIREGGVGFLHYETPSSAQSLGELLDLLLEVDPGPVGIEKAFSLLMRTQALGSLARSWGVSGGSLGEVQRELLGEDEVLLAYLPSHHRSHLFIVDRENVVHRTLADRNTLQLARDQLAPVFFRRPTNASFAVRRLERAARRLADLLLPPAAWRAIEDARAVTIVGADLLDATPFECFAPMGGRPLGLTHAVSYLPSLPVGLELARRHVSGPSAHAYDLVVVASPQQGDGHDGLEPLGLTEDALGPLWGSFPPERVVVRLGQDASIDALRSPEVARARALQVVTHGWRDEEEERPAALLLTPSTTLADGIFRCRDAKTLTSPPIVVLGACGADRGRLRRGEDGVNGFGGAFLAAGAEVVLLSFGELDQAATLELSRIFHSNVADGVPPAEALRRGRVEVARRQGWEHAYFHSGLRVIGLGNRRY